MTDIISLDLISKSFKKEDILKKLKYSEGDIVFLSGSLITGLGNMNSDLDIFVLNNDFLSEKEKGDYVYEFKNSRVDFTNIKNIACDIEYWSLNLLKELIKQINNINLEDENIRVLNEINILGSLSDISSLIHRLITGVCVYNEEEFKKLVKNLELKKFYHLMIRHYINLVDNKYEDIIGNIKSKKYYTAVIVGRESLITLMMAYLYSKKVSIDRGKWVFLKLQKLAEKDKETERILNKFKKIYFEQLLEREESLKNNAESILIFVNKVISSIEKNIGGL